MKKCKCNACKCAKNTGGEMAKFTSEELRAAMAALIAAAPKKNLELAIADGGEVAKGLHAENLKPGEFVADNWAEGKTNAVPPASEIVYGSPQAASGGGAERMIQEYSNFDAQRGFAQLVEKLDRELGSMRAYMKSVGDNTETLKAALAALLAKAKKDEDEHEEGEEESETEVEAEEQKEEGGEIEIEVANELEEDEEEEGEDEDSDEEDDDESKKARVDAAKSYLGAAKILLNRAAVLRKAASKAKTDKAIKACHDGAKKKKDAAARAMKRAAMNARKTNPDALDASSKAAKSLLAEIRALAISKGLEDHPMLKGALKKKKADKPPVATAEKDMTPVEEEKAKKGFNTQEIVNAVTGKGVLNASIEDVIRAIAGGGVSALMAPPAQTVAKGGKLNEIEGLLLAKAGTGEITPAEENFGQQLLLKAKAVSMGVAPPGVLKRDLEMASEPLRELFAGLLG